MLSARRERHCVRSPTVIRVTDAPSRTQIDKLGQRLARPSYHATTDDLTLLEQFRAEHSEPLRKASEALRSLGLQPTSRTKTTGTIVDKLRREHPMRLTQMEDIAGLRVVVEMTRDTQDELVQRILAALPEGAKAKDRRVHPSHGYRAVHVVARVAGHQVEIQVRTRLQDLWAQMMERLADSWGRQIRYGQAPSHPSERIAVDVTRSHVVGLLLSVSDRIDRVERGQVSVERWEASLEQLSRAGQNYIDELLGDEAISIAEHTTEVVKARREVSEGEAEVRGLLQQLDTLLHKIERGTIT